METKKPKILVLFYSMYGHTFQLAQAVAAGIADAGGEALVKSVPELIPEEKWNERQQQVKHQMQDYAPADPKTDLSGIDGLALGSPTRFGNMTAQMRNFWDQTSDTWLKGGLIGKPAAVFTSSATQHGGQETTLVSMIVNLLHHGCLIVGLPYSNQEQMTLTEITGGSPYGASTIAGGQGERQPSANELVMARALGARLASVAQKLMD